ncbi:hypothetical protein H2200_009761 [Cladophialophora chaetospira]|uniref:Xylanolytic transcriptional activator regulatory domain-containing protein n=1 Tax=Cladophialophora chaetospira TaxID=386627 RepID=A0AA38X3D2_9EURO|nr:hypothetical protein H2200_009761 [Cladophialophora chaetospira]
MSQQLAPSQNPIDPPFALAAEPTNGIPSSSVATVPLSGAVAQPTSLLPDPYPQDRPSDIPSTTASHGTTGYLGSSGLLNLFEPDYRGIARNDTNQVSTVPDIDERLPPLELQQSFAETYFDYCWPWCPVLDKDSFWKEYSTVSPPALLTNALALLGTQIRPPIIQHADAAEYYTRAKMHFYLEDETDPRICLQAIMLFYWWAPRGPSQVHKDAAWWWTGVAIKYAQQMGLHREPKNLNDVGGEAIQKLRRRMWWTLFVNDCDVREPTIQDFEASEQSRAEVFIQWVRLCTTIGPISQHLSRPAASGAFPTPLAEELITWVGNLPQRLRVPDMSDRNRKFNRDVLKLHLPYLTTVTILHLNWSSRNPSQPWPEAYTAAVLSASFVTRIFKDLLARGEIRFLGAIACWYVGVAIVALLHAQRIDVLADGGAEDIVVLRLALNELAKLWPSTAIFVKGFDRLRAFDTLGPKATVATEQTRQPRLATDAVSPSISQWSHGIDWKRYFPEVTATTCRLAAILLAEHQQSIWDDIPWLNDETTTQFQDLFDFSDLVSDPVLETLSSLCWAGDSLTTYQNQS